MGETEGHPRQSTVRDHRCSHRFLLADGAELPCAWPDAAHDWHMGVVRRQGREFTVLWESGAMFDVA